MTDDNWRFFDAHMLMGHVLGIDKNAETGLNGTTKSWLSSKVYGTAYNKILSRMNQVPSRETFDIYFANWHNGTGNRQIMMSTVYVPNGGVSIQKSDSETKKTTPQGGSSFKGATFEIRNSSGKSVATLTTNDKGYAATKDDAIPAGTYTVVETVAPPGYKKSASFTVKVTSGKITKATNGGSNSSVAETPERGGIFVQKKDSESNKVTPQGDASFAGAVFTIYNRSDNPIWYNGKEYAVNAAITTIKTNDDGYAATALNAFPMGTYGVKETKSPDGYEVNGKEYTVTITTGKYNKLTNAVTNKVDTPSASTGLPQTAKRGGVFVQKKDSETNQLNPQGDGTLQGATFAIYNKSAEPIWYDGKSVAVDGLITTITTDATGLAKTSTTALPKGTYLLKETGASTGYNVNAKEYTFHIGDGKYDTLTNAVTDKVEQPSAGTAHPQQVKRGGIRVRKVDTDTLSINYFNHGEAQGDATLDGTTLYLYNRSIHSVRVGGKDYAKDARITTIPLEGGSTSDVLTIKNGTAATAADALPYGTYEVIEATPGTGYLLSDDKQTFQVREDGVIVDPGATSDDAKIENKVITGGITIAKFTKDFTDDTSEKDVTNNPQGDATLKGAEFTLTNVSEKAIQIDGKVYDVGADLVDNILTVSDDGYARSGKILPYGTYELRETKAPAGYKLDDTVWRFSIREDGQTITFDKMDGSTEVDGGDNHGTGAHRGAIDDNYHGGIRIIKADDDLFELRDDTDELPDGYDYGHAQGDASLDGTEFGIWNRSAHKVDVGGRIYEPNERIMTIPLADGTKSDVLAIENGTAETSKDALPYGTYEVRETKSTSSYEDTKQTWEFAIRESDENKIKEPSDDDVVKDSVVRGGITMPKIDHDLAGIDGEAEKENNAQGDATMEGAEFAVRNASANEVVVGGHVYQTGERITTIPQPDGSIKDVIVADANGLASTSANALPVGKYQIWETKAPEGYELNTTDTWTVEISLTETNTDINKNVKPGNIDDRIDDKVIRGGLSVQKVDKETGTGNTLTAGSVTPEDDATDENVDNAENATDDEVSEQANDDGNENGESASEESSDETTSDGEYTEPEFSPGSDLSGTQFAIVNRSKDHVYVDGTLYKVGEVVKTITTNGKGYAATDADELPYGTYDVYEVAEPVRYISSADSYGNSNAVDEDGEFVLDAEGNRLTPKFVQTVVIRKPNVIVPCARPFANQVKRGDIAFEKIDDDGNIMPNVAFKVTSKTTGESHIIMTDENGVFDSSSNHMRHSKDTNANDGAFNSDGNIDDSALNGDSGVWFYGNAAGEPFWTDEKKTLPNNTDRFGFIPVIEHEEKFLGFDNVEKDENGQVVDGVAFQVNENGEWVDYTTMSAADETSEGGDEVENGEDAPADSDAISSVILSYDAEASTFSLTVDDGEPVVLGISDIRFPNPDADELTYVQEITDPSLLFDVYDGEYWNRVGIGAVNQDGLVTKSVTQNEDGTWTVVTPEQYATATDEDTTDGEGNESADDSDTGVNTQADEESDVETGDSDDADTDTDTDVEDEPLISDGSVDVTENEDGSLTCTYPSDWVMSVISTTQACGMNRFGYVDADGDGEYDFPADYDDSEAYTETTQYPMYTPDDLLGAFPYDTYVFEELPSEATYGHKLVTFEVNVERHNYTVNLGPVTDNIIDLHTTATDQEDGDKQLATNEQVTIIDRVEYTNLNEGREYTLHGVLMDYETAEPLLDRDGNQITSTVTFTPESPNGYVDVTFTLDASQLGGIQTVVFEDLYLNKVHVASHADIEDEGQRVEFSPEIHTTALGKDTNDHFVYDAPSVTIVDTVHYEGLVPGREFVIQGVLMDKSTGEELIDSQGNVVTSEAHFVPESNTGDVQVEFTFDTTSLVGVDTVVFEDLYRVDTGGEMNGQLRHVAAHRDINDAGQTVSVRLSDLASDLVQTGSNAIIATAAGGAAAISAIAYFVYKKNAA